MARQDFHPYQAAVWMLAVMVSVTIAVAAFLYCRERTQLAEMDAQEAATADTSAPASKTASNDFPAPAAKLDSAAAAAQARTSEKSPGAGGVGPGTTGGADSTAAGPDKSANPAPTTARQGPPVDREKQEKYRQVVAGVRAMMAKRDLIGAKVQVSAGSSLAQTPEEQSEIARLDALVDHLREFWRTLAQVAAALQPAQEFTVHNTPVIVVEAGPTQLKLRSEGRNQTYSVKDLPRAMVDALVQTGFADDPSSKVLYGAFLAFDPQGDRQMARKVWQQAIDAGREVKDFLLELDAAPKGPVKQ